MRLGVRTDYRIWYKQTNFLILDLVLLKRSCAVLARGTFSATFLLAVAAAIELEAIALEDL